MRYPQPGDSNSTSNTPGVIRYPTSGDSESYSHSPGAAGGANDAGGKGAGGKGSAGKGAGGKHPTKGRRKDPGKSSNGLVAGIIIVVVILATGLFYALVNDSSAPSVGGVNPVTAPGSGSGGGSSNYTPPPQLNDIKLPLGQTIDFVMDVEYSTQTINISIPEDDTYVVNVTSDSGIRYNADLRPADYSHPLRYVRVMNFEDRGPQLRTQFGGAATDKLGQNYLTAGDYELDVIHYENGESTYEVSLTRESFNYPFSTSGIVPALDAPQASMSLDQKVDATLPDNKDMWIGEIELTEPGIYSFDYHGAIDEHVLVMALDVETLQTWTASYRSSSSDYATDGDFSEPFLVALLDAGTYYVVVQEEYAISNHSFNVVVSSIDY